MSRTLQARYWILAVLLFSIAASAYLYNLTGWVQNDDEGTYLYQAWRVSLGEMPYRDFMSSQWPLFLYAGGALINLSGPSLWALRAFSVVLFLVTAGLLFLLARHTLGPGVAVVAALIFLAHPDTYYQARFFQSEALMLPFAVGGLYLLQRAREEEYRRRWVTFLAGVSFALALLSKSLGLFPLMGALITILLDALSWGRGHPSVSPGNRCALPERRRQIAKGALALLLGFILIAGVVLGGFDIAVPDLYGSLVGHHLRQGQGRTLMEVLYGGIRLYQRYFRAYPLLVVLALGYFGLRIAGKAPERQEVSRLFAGQVLAALGFLVLSRDLGLRHLMYLLPSLAALAAASLAALWALARDGITLWPPSQNAGGEEKRGGTPRAPRETAAPSPARRASSWAAAALITGLLAALLLPWGVADYREGTRREDDTMRVVAFIKSRTDPTDVVLSDYPGLNFHARRRAPYSGAEVSYITVSNGRITGQRLIEEIAAEHVRMVIIDVGMWSGHQLIRLADYPRFLRYLRRNFTPLPPLHRVDETLMVYWAEVPPDSPENPVIIQYPQTANLNDEISFLGYDLDKTRLVPGEALHLRLYWRAERPVSQDWSIFTHLLDSQETVRGQMDKVPLDGLYPTSRWLPGEVVDDDFELVLAADAPPGEYRLEVGMYNWMTGERLPVFDTAGQRVPNDRILLETVIEVTAQSR